MLRVMKGHNGLIFIGEPNIFLKIKEGKSMEFNMFIFIKTQYLRLHFASKPLE